MFTWSHSGDSSPLLPTANFPQKQLLLIACQPGSLWWQHLHLLYNYPFKYWKIVIRPTLSHLLSRLKNPNPFNLSSYIKFFNRLIISVEMSLHRTVASFSISLELETPKPDTVFQVCPNKSQVKWDNYIPWSAGCVLADAAQAIVCLHCCKYTLLTLACYTPGPEVLCSRATIQTVRLQPTLLSEFSISCPGLHIYFC